MDVVYQGFGACRTVTGSRHLFHIGDRTLLLDCGAFQGTRSESRERNAHLPFSPDAVILSHAHIDHIGALPALVRNGWRGKIHATAATRALAQHMLLDAARLARMDAEHLSRERRKDEPEIVPPFDEADVDATIGMMTGYPYGRAFSPFSGVEARFQDAGHIIGSAGIELRVDGGPSIHFTGDVGRNMVPILRDPLPLPDVDFVLSECTYGAKDHPPSELAGDALRAELARMVERRGKVFIPAFSVGRTQNLIYAIAQLWQQGRLPPFPVYVDSPLADKATDVYAAHPECYDVETTRFLASGGRPFHPEFVRYIESREESKELNRKPGPFVVVAGSGMCEGGRIVHHLLHHLGDRDATVLMVGWCAPHTLGRRLIDGESPVRVLGSWRDVRARVARLNAWSAHAGRSELFDLLEPAVQSGAEIQLVHGEESVALGFAEDLRARGARRVVVPEAYARYPIQKRSRESAAAKSGSAVR